MPIKVAVSNNGTLGFAALEVKASGFLATGTSLINPDFAAMARAIGIHAIRLEDRGDLEAAIFDVLSHDGLALLDVVTNPQKLAMPPTIRAEQVQRVSLWALRAVINRRGDQLVELVTATCCGEPPIRSSIEVTREIFETFGARCRLRHGHGYRMSHHLLVDTVFAAAPGRSAERARRHPIGR